MALYAMRSAGGKTRSFFLLAAGSPTSSDASRSFSSGDLKKRHVIPLASEKSNQMFLHVSQVSNTSQNAGMIGQDSGLAQICQAKVAHPWWPCKSARLQSCPADDLDQKVSVATLNKQIPRVTASVSLKRLWNLTKTLFMTHLSCLHNS